MDKKLRLLQRQPPTTSLSTEEVYAASQQNASLPSHPHHHHHATSSSAGASPQPQSFADLINDLLPMQSLPTRLSALQQLDMRIRSMKYVDLHEIWSCMADMPDSGSKKIRLACLQFMQTCIALHYEELGVLRPFFFSIVQSPVISQKEMLQKLLCLRGLIKNGRDLDTVEFDILPLMNGWLVDIADRASWRSSNYGFADSPADSGCWEHLQPCLMLLSNVLKFNFVYFDEASLVRILQTVCSISQQVLLPGDMRSCLMVLDSVVRYGYVPAALSLSVTHVLCKFVNTERFCTESWDVMKNILRSFQSCRAVQSLQQTLDDIQYRNRPALLRGAVFHLSMAFWGAQRIDSLPFSFFSILPSFRHVVSYRETAVDYEVVLSITRLVRKFSHQLSALEWDLIVDISIGLSHYAKNQNGMDQKSRQQSSITELYRDFLIHITESISTSSSDITFKASPDKFWPFMASVKDILPEHLALIIFDHLSASDRYHPSMPDWLPDLTRLIQQFFIDEPRPSLQLRLLQFLGRQWVFSRMVYMGEWVREVLVTSLRGLARIADEQVADACFHLMLLPFSDGPRVVTPMEAHELLAILKGCVIDELAQDVGMTRAAACLVYVFEYVFENGLNDVFDEAMNALLSVLAFRFTETSSLARTQAVTACAACLLRLGGTSTEMTLHCNILLTELISVFESFAVFNNSGASSTALQLEPVQRRLGTFTLRNVVNQNVYLDRYLDRITNYFMQRCPWSLFKCIQQNLPEQLHHCSMFISCQEKIASLCEVLSSQAIAEKVAEQVVGIPTSVKRSELYQYGFHILQSLIVYRDILSKGHTDDMLMGLQLGLRHSPSQCVHLMLLCGYELPLSTSKYLSSILQRLSQMMTAPWISVHILEYLSILARMPRLYANFVEGDYRKIFGIAIQYIQYHYRLHSQQTTAIVVASSSSPAGATTTAPPINTGSIVQSTFSQYVLVMAFHVIITWYNVVRPSERKKYAPFIIRGLLSSKDPVTPTDMPNTMDEKIETCLDILSQSTFDSPQSTSNKPFDSSSSPYQQKSRLSKTWMIGHALVTASVNTLTNNHQIEICIRRAAGKTVFYISRSEYCVDSVDDHATGQDQEAEKAREIISQELLHNTAFAFMSRTFGYNESDNIAPMLLPDDTNTERVLSVLDRTPVVDLHKIGVVYVGKNQTKELDILSNEFGSTLYTDFIQCLGSWARLKGCKSVYTGGLDTSDDLDGSLACYWRDEWTQVIFHIATLMPTNLQSDPHCLGKKRHIGNDFVTVVYNDSGSMRYDFTTIPGQFNFVNIVVTPLHTDPNDRPLFHVVMQRRGDMPDIGPLSEPKVITSVERLGPFVRQIALHANIFAQIFLQLLKASSSPTTTSITINPSAAVATGADEYISNNRERLRQIKRLRDRLKQSAGNQPTMSSDSQQAFLLGLPFK